MNPSRPHNLAPLRGVLFDMDGTLTAPLLDFPLIKREIGIGDEPILEAMAAMNDADRDRANAILLRHELDAVERSTLNTGCRELLELLDRCDIACAVVTRNSLASAEAIMRMHALRFDVLITRDDSVFKPHPRPVLLACERLGVAPADAWMVGDGIYDVQAGNAAGVRTVWLSHGRERGFDAPPWRTVKDLLELRSLLSDYGLETRAPRGG